MRRVVRVSPGDRSTIGRVKSLWKLLVTTVAVVVLAAASAAAATAPSLLKKLPTAGEQNSGYDRDAFEHWSDVPGKGCDTREWVLYRQNRVRPAACGGESGSWISVYDGKRFSNPSDLDVDHMVPLAEAHGSGAGTWSAGQREAFANDLFRFSLIAVSAASNRSKSDRDPAEWLPSKRSFVCKYVARWTAVKFRWRLSVDPREKATLRRTFNDCSKQALKVGAVPRASVAPAEPGVPGGQLDPQFETCSEANAAGYGPYVRGVDPEYEWYRDGDSDGVTCEP